MEMVIQTIARRRRISGIALGYSSLRTIEKMLSSKDTVEEVSQPTRRKYDVMLSICDILGLQPPAQNKGSTISSFYLDVVEALSGERKSLGKHQILRLAIKAAVNGSRSTKSPLNWWNRDTARTLLDLESAVIQKIGAPSSLSIDEP